MSFYHFDPRVVLRNPPYVSLLHLLGTKGSTIKEAPRDEKVCTYGKVNPPLVLHIGSTHDGTVQKSHRNSRTRKVV